MQLLKDLAPYVEHTSEVVTSLKGEQAERMAALEDTIRSYCQMKDERKSAETAGQAVEIVGDARGPLQAPGSSLTNYVRYVTLCQHFDVAFRACFHPGPCLL